MTLAYFEVALMKMFNIPSIGSQ